MDQNRPDLANNHQQNVHLHMHHVCACQNIYPSTYYPPISYRTPLISYATPQTVTRPYLQHYQYTQFNVGGQYNIPMTQMSTSTFGTASTHPPTDISIAVPTRERREKGDSQESVAEPERMVPDPPADFEFGSLPSVSELFMMNNSEDFQMNTDSFIKFLERSCLTAEQIAYRNRNRPCFRNIQNLCIRTRSEILKPRTTISNIHSQGIPWATKDFIYAFVRLTNCWHILKGYWENREGSALGKIEKELSPGFKACYVRWEKETVELATELTRIFYNLDVNQSNPGPSINAHTANNLIPPQVSLLKTSPETTKKTTSNETMSASTLTNMTASNSKNVRGILHLPSAVSAETVDQANQTCAGDFCIKSDDNESEEDNSIIYMKPGSYHVPKYPRVIEFLDTAQNISKGLEAANDKYWVKVKSSTAKKAEQKSEMDDVLQNEFNSEVFFNVNQWLSNNNFSDYAEPSSSSTSPPKTGGDVLNNSNDMPSTLDPDGSGKTSLTLLQRNSGVNSCIEQISSRTYRRKSDSLNIFAYEMKNGGLTKRAKGIFDNIFADLKTTDLASVLDDGFLEGPTLETIQKNLAQDSYRYVNEVVRDLRHIVKFYGQHLKYGPGEDQLNKFSGNLERSLGDYFPNCDFGTISGNREEKVGKLKIRNCLLDIDSDYTKN